MKQLLKKIYLLLIQISKTVVSIICVFIFNNNKVQKKIRTIKKGRNGRAISILANGPSIKNIITNRKYLLQDTDILALNYFGNTDSFFKLKPQYYILLDPAYFDSNITVKSEQGEKSDSSQEKLLMENFMKIDWNMILFIPYTKQALKRKDTYMNNSHIHVVFYHATRVVGFEKFQNWMYRHNQGIPSSRNVIIPAMMLMANIGYKKIYLYGTEFSWTRTMDIDPKNGMMFFNDGHFYSKSEIRYFGKGGYKWWLEAIVEMLGATEIVERYAKSQDVHIINRTIGSFIDAFDYEMPQNNCDEEFKY